MVFKILEMNFFRPNRIMFIFSAVPFIIYSLSSLDLHEVENCCDLFFQEIMFFKSVFCRVLTCSVWTLLWSHDVTLIGWICPSGGLPWPSQGGTPFLCAPVGVAVELDGWMKKIVSLQNLPSLSSLWGVACRGTCGRSPLWTVLFLRI